MNALQLLNLLQKISEQQGVGFMNRFHIQFSDHENGVADRVQYKIDDRYQILTIFKNA